MSETAHPNLNLTAEEKRAFYQYFQAADTTNLGVVTGETAVPFFEKTKLPPDTLGLIWQIADKENRGLLTPSGFSVVLRLIGHAQAGSPPTEELALQPGPLPRFEGISNAPPSRPATTSPPPSAPGGPVRVPPLSPEDVNKFSSLFEKSDTPSGMISGETAKQIFERARLPNEILGRIWNLADTKQRGQLDATEFVIAMHLLTSYKTGAMRGIPQSLPPGLYEAAARRGLVRTSTGPRVGPEVPPVPAIPTQYTGPRTQSPLTRPPFASPLSAHSTGGDWMISPQEKAQFDTIFATVDTAKAGIISGDQAVTFFTNAQLPEDVLAQIWDLADIDADGQLTRDEFAVAMYLVRQQRSRKEPIPAVLPPALIPPSMRRQAAVPPIPAAVVPSPAPAPPAAGPLPRSAAEDLFGLDTFSTPGPAAPAQVPQSTGSSNPPFQSPGSPSSRTSHQGSSATFKPFVPSSHFGQSLGPQLTGIGASAARSPPPPSDDLLGDNDPEESKKLTQETTELGNLSNQIGSLAKEMQNVQTQRASAEQDLTQASQQKRDFEARLAQARSMYEKEVKDFKALEERLNASRAETRKLQQEYALLEGSRQDLQSQYEQASTALASDQSENVNLKERIRQINAAVSQLKPALEKARSEARQQKGLVAINKKQLATVEGERDRMQGEIESLAKEKEEYGEPAQPGQPAQPVSQTADLASPALSTVSQQTNPFFKRQTTGSSERTVSPSSNPQVAFDNLFGPSFTSPTTSTPPPAISFGAGSPSGQHASDVSKSPDTSGIPTPSVSPGPPAISDPPPPPPQSRQITPSVLPLGNEGHFASVTSSTAVSPPASRFGGPDVSEADTPLRLATENSNGLPSSTATDKSAALSPFDEIPEPSVAHETPEGTVSIGEDQAQPFPPIPGSLPMETPPANHEAAATAEASHPAKDVSFDELFGNVSRERSQSQKANDFEEAFAGMKPRNTPPGTASNGMGTGEFPPIKELENDDDDDDSTDNEEPMGFDDNFTSTSPPHKGQHSNNESIDATQLHAFPAPGSGATSSQPPPPLEAQSSPPSYDTAGATDEPGGFPRAFGDLLPKRTDPTLAPDAPHSVESSSGAPIVAGEAQKKTAAPDFNAAFAQLDLAPAKEEDDSEEEDIAVPHSHQQPTDFDFSFDSPSQSSKAVTSPSAQPGALNTAAADFFSFDNNVHPSATQADAHPSTTQPAASGTATDHDWDAIFAPLKDSQFSAGDSNGAAHLAASPAATGSDGRPPGWALAADTGEDDLILQRLTGMGYARDESLAALEKFDYNIDKAADYLTSRS